MLHAQVLSWGRLLTKFSYNSLVLTWLYTKVLIGGDWVPTRSRVLLWSQVDSISRHWSRSVWSDSRHCSVNTTEPNGRHRGHRGPDMRLTSTSSWGCGAAIVTANPAQSCVLWCSISRSLNFSLIPSLLSRNLFISPFTNSLLQPVDRNSVQRVDSQITRVKSLLKGRNWSSHRPQSFTRSQMECFETSESFLFDLIFSVFKKNL